MKKTPRLGPELFYTDASGQKTDADLHSEMLDNVSPQDEEALTGQTIKLAQKLGFSPQAIKALSPQPSGYATGGPVPTTPRIKRDAFLYMAPKPPVDSFAQCGTCFMFTGTGCTILGKTKITKDMTCGVYVRGKPQYNLKGREQSLATPQEVGLINHQVRCENCRYGGPSCKLFEMLNNKMPGIFNLDIKINPKGCCNGFTKKGS